MLTSTAPDFTARARVEPCLTWDDKPAIVVRVSFPNAGTDRTEGCGFHLPDTPAGHKLAARMVRAVEAGAVHHDHVIGTDVHGLTYVHAPSRVLGRMMNADLRRLGF